MRFKVALLCSAVALTGAPELARAQSAAAGATEVEAVVVTARKREENLQEVPVAVTAVSDEAIEQRSLTELRNIQDVVPNILFTESQGVKGTARIFIRGIGENIQIFSSDPAVGVYVDGVPITRPQGANLGLLDVERVEVLRGPQGTTFGKNTIGGSINFVSKRPGDEFDGSAKVRLGNYNLVTVEAAVDVPVNERLSLRLSGGRNERDGFVENTFNGGRLSDLDNWTTRLAALFTPAENVEFLLSADYFERNESSNVPQMLSYNPSTFLISHWNSVATARYGFDPMARSVDNDPFRGFYSGGAAVTPGQPSIVAEDPLLDRYELGSSPNSTQQRIFGTYLITTLDLDDTFTVKSLTSYRHTLAHAWFDSWGSAVPNTGTMLEENSTDMTQELQFIGNDLLGGRLNFVSGLFIGEVVSDEVGTQWFEPEVMAVPFGPIALNFSTGRDQTQTTNTVAAFGNANYNITEQLQVTLGARWTRDTKKFHRREFATFPTGTDIGFGPASPPARPTPTGAPVRFDDKKSWEAWSGTVAVQYQWTEDLMTYASWSRGFRSGGFSGTARNIADLEPYNPELVDNYEIGLRSSWFADRLILNATAFHMNYEERQMTATQVISTVPFVSRTYIFNAGASENRGVEVELTARPIEPFTITAAYGYTDAKYTELAGPFSPASTVEADLRKELPQTPEHTFNTSATYRTAIPSLPGEFSLTVDYAYRSKMYYDVFNTPDIAEDGYGLINARIGWTSDDDNLEVAVWGRNLADERYRTDGVAVAGVFSSAYYGDPLTFGVELTKRLP